MAVAFSLLVSCRKADKTGDNFFKLGREITFDQPREFVFIANRDGTIRIKVRPDLENIVDFTGQIVLFRNYDEYWREQDLSGYRPASFDRNIQVFTFGDAGAMSTNYLVSLNDPPNNRGALVEFNMSTYEDPAIWGTMEEERRIQIDNLKRLFESMVLSARFK